MKRVLIGKLGTEWVMRVSLPGYDVLTAPHYKLAFDSIRTGLLLHATGVAYVPDPGHPSCSGAVPETSTTVYFSALAYAPLALIQAQSGTSFYGAYMHSPYCPSNYWYWQFLRSEGFADRVVIRNQTAGAAYNVRWAVFNWQGV